MNESQRCLAQLIITGLDIKDHTPDDIDPMAPLFGDGLGLDSFDAFDLVDVVERNFNISIPNMEISRKAFACLAALESFITSQAPVATHSA
jgi:acyl carrier protein